MANRKGKRRGTSNGQKPAPSSDGGDLLLVILLLWALGFVSFHSRDEGKAINRLKDVQAELRKAEAQLQEISRILPEIQAESAVLEVRRSDLKEQVTRLEKARDGIAANLSLASTMVTSPPRSGWSRFTEGLFTGIVGNLISAGIIFICGLFVGARRSRITKEA